jgi:hypothetical protein
VPGAPDGGLVGRTYEGEDGPHATIALTPPPPLGKRRHRSLARRLLGVRRAAYVAVVTAGPVHAVAVSLRADFGATRRGKALDQARHRAGGPCGS